MKITAQFRPEQLRVNRRRYYTFYSKRVTIHPKYGEQQVETYEKAADQCCGTNQILFLDKFPGIGKKTAERIVALFPT